MDFRRYPDSRVRDKAIAEDQPRADEAYDHQRHKQPSLSEAKQGNVEEVIQQVMVEESLQLIIRDSADRLSVHKQGSVCPLQSPFVRSNNLLIHLLIIRYADRGSINKGFQLHRIRGIVASY